MSGDKPLKGFCLFCTSSNLYTIDNVFYRCQACKRICFVEQPQKKQKPDPKFNPFGWMMNNIQEDGNELTFKGFCAFCFSAHNHVGVFGDVACLACNRIYYIDVSKRTFLFDLTDYESNTL